MSNDIAILTEQDGESERDLKKQLAKMFKKSGKRLRAYLALVQYSAEQDIHVALLIRSDSGEAEILLNQCQHIFRNMFSETNHLDIIFISDDLEQKIRNVCCPFYTSVNFNVSKPDFYLYTDEGYHLDDVVRSCYMRARLFADRPDGYMLCDVNPPLNGKNYEIKNRDINQIIIGNKSKGMTLFPVSGWPFPIYVLASQVDNIAFQEIIDSSNSKLIAWAEIYKTRQDAQAALDRNKKR